MARQAALFCVTLMAWLVWGFYTPGAQTASAQTIPQISVHPGDFVVGTNQMTGQIDSRYTLTVSQNISGNIELNRVIPAQPENHTFNTFLLAGSYSLLGLGEECTGYLDEARTPAEFDFTKKFAMIFTGTPIVVNPAPGADVAWIWFQCVYPQPTDPGTPNDPGDPNQPVTPPTVTIQIFLPTIKTTLASPVEVVYPLAGLVYTGTLASTQAQSNLYLVRWLNNGELDMTLPTTPENFSISLVVWKGQNFIRLRQECKLMLDENLTGDVWNNPSQTLIDDGNGMNFNVTPKTGDVAWAAIECMF